MQKVADITEGAIGGIVVGLPVRNEAQNLGRALISIRDAISYCKRPYVRMVICINGCTDSSKKIAEIFCNENPKYDIHIIESEEGLVHAQRKIVDMFPARIHVFPDADNVIAEDSIGALLSELERDPDLVVVYARTVPLRPHNNTSIFGAIGHLYDSQSMLTKREYLHGRLFATRDWHVPKDEEIFLRANKSSSGAYLLKYAIGTAYLAADDIYMSAYIMDKHGMNAIKQIDAARCFSWSVGSLKDWYLVYRRTNIELEKLYCWFPEFRYLKPYLYRKTDWKKWRKAAWNKRAQWLIFLVMRRVFFILVRTELLLARAGVIKPRAQWVTTKTTKLEHAE